MATNMNNPMKVIMLVTMAVQRDRVSMVMSSVTNVDTTVSNHMKVEMLVTMAVQRASKMMTSAVMLAMMAIHSDGISMVMSSVTKMDTNMNNQMVVMLVMNSVGKIMFVHKI